MDSDTTTRGSSAAPVTWVDTVGVIVNGCLADNWLACPTLCGGKILTFAYNLTANAQTTQKLDVTINEADGDVEIMLPNTFQWIPAPSEAGSTFSEGTRIRTGPFSSVSLVFTDSSVVMVDSFTFMTVEKFFKTGNVEIIVYHEKAGNVTTLPV